MAKQNIATLVTMLGLGCGSSEEQQVAYEKQLQVYNEQCILLLISRKSYG